MKRVPQPTAAERVPLPCQQTIAPHPAQTTTGFSGPRASAAPCSPTSCAASRAPWTPKVRRPAGAARRPAPAQQIENCDGGSGAIFSVGLLKRLNATLFDSCVRGQEVKMGGPAFAHDESTWRSERERLRAAPRCGVDGWARPARPPPASETCVCACCARCPSAHSPSQPLVCRAFGYACRQRHHSDKVCVAPR